jgi:hypothetical protein
MDIFAADDSSNIYDTVVKAVAAVDAANQADPEFNAVFPMYFSTVLLFSDGVDSAQVATMNQAIQSNTFVAAIGTGAYLNASLFQSYLQPSQNVPFIGTVGPYMTAPRKRHPITPVLQCQSNAAWYVPADRTILYSLLLPCPRQREWATHTDGVLQGSNKQYLSLGRGDLCLYFLYRYRRSWTVLRPILAHLSNGGARQNVNCKRRNHWICVRSYRKPTDNQ